MVHAEAPAAQPQGPCIQRAQQARQQRMRFPQRGHFGVRVLVEGRARQQLEQLDVVDKIAGVRTGVRMGMRDVPDAPEVIKSVSIVE